MSKVNNPLIKKNYAKKATITYRGYTLNRKDIGEDLFKELKRDLTVKPNVIPDFDFGTQSFPVFRYSPKKIFLPKYYGIKRFGLPPVENNKERVGSLIKKDRLKFEAELRPDQKTFMKKIKKHIEEKGSCVAHATTGSGKTVCGLWLASQFNKKTLIIVHKEFLMNQWKERIEQFIPKARIGIIRQNKVEVENKDIVIGMLQSISQKDDYPKEIFDQMGLILFDEVHHISSRCFSQTLFKVPTAKMLGLSATPKRKDGLTKVLKWFLGDIISKEHLATRIETPSVEFVNAVYTSDIKPKYNFKNKVNVPNLITQLSEDPGRNQLIVDQIIKYTQTGRKILLLSDRRNHCLVLKKMIEKDLKEKKIKRINSQGSLTSKISVGLYLGSMKEEHLNESNKCDIILATFSMAAEGYDNSTLDTLVLATSKCLGINTPVLMYDGKIKMVQDVKIGDLLMGDDSTPRKVLRLSRGKDILYEIKPYRGESFICNSSHILSLKCTNYGVYNSKKYKSPWGAKYFNNNTISIQTKFFQTEKEARDFLKNIPQKNKICNISVENYINSKLKNNLRLYKTKVEFPYKKTPFDPYMIGYWIGDGHKKGPLITTQDSTVIKYFKENLSKYNLYLSYSSDYSYRICSLKKNKSNKLLNVLRDLNLINNKHIPDIYKINSRKVRLEFLAGIIDSDGHKDGSCYAITQKDESLSDEIVYIARSLGFSSNKKIKKTSWTYKGVKKYGTAFIILISGNGKDINQIPVKIKRKIIKINENPLFSKDVLVNGFKIIEKPRGNFYGFEIDGNKKFLLGDFTVTHNSDIEQSVGRVLRKRNKFPPLIIDIADPDYRYNQVKVRKQFYQKRGFKIIGETSNSKKNKEPEHVTFRKR